PSVILLRFVPARLLRPVLRGLVLPGVRGLCAVIGSGRDGVGARRSAGGSGRGGGGGGGGVGRSAHEDVLVAHPAVRRRLARRRRGADGGGAAGVELADGRRRPRSAAEQAEVGGDGGRRGEGDGHRGGGDGDGPTTFHDPCSFDESGWFVAHGTEVPPRGRPSRD